MKRILMTLTAAALMLGRCTPATMPDMTPDSNSSTVGSTDEKAYVPLNFQYQKGMWIPYTDYADLMTGKSENEFRKEIGERLRKAADEGINTVFFHVRPDGTAYYRSSLFPKGTSLDGDYDPLAITLDEAHKLGISVHAWINPLRLTSVGQIGEVPDNYRVKQLFSNGDASEVDRRLYLYPDSADVLELLHDEITELIENYDVDGIHIDDYFYPSADEAFDAVRFAESGEYELKQWRINVISEMVRTMYDAVKAADSEVLFGISPQGNIKADYESQFADVKRWLSEKGFCDYMIPQIYYGFNNETLPFLPTLAEWISLPRDRSVRLIIGLGAYKLGKEDKWAGDTGEKEWIDSPDVIERQIAAVENSDADGYALYY